MCGIAGFLEDNGLPADAETRQEQMLRAIAHRGPDDQGRWLDPAAGISLGHLRLAIVDLSSAGHQPMLSACGRWVLTFNGEIYNFAGLRQEIEAAGWQGGWRGHSDTEVLLAAIATWGTRVALQRCVGMFAFALWDRHDRTLTLARDRIGEKPLYYGRLGKSFVFASELAAFFQHPDWRGEVDRDALARLMRFGNVPAPASIFRDVAKLRPAHLMTVRSGDPEPRTECYWDAAEMATRGQADPFQGSPQEAVDRLDALLRQSLAGQTLADVPLGAFLSGGIDSSTVVAVMQSMSPTPVHTFSIGFDEAAYNEADHAKRVAEHLGTQHTELYVSPSQARDVIPRLPSIYSEPFADASQIPTFLVSQLARRSVTVALSGDGGDELFSGYSRYATADRFRRRLGSFPRPVGAAAAGLIRSISPSSWQSLLDIPLGLIPSRRRYRNVGDKLHKLAGVLTTRADDEFYRRIVSHWQDPTRLVPLSREDVAGPATPNGAQGLESFVHRMMYWDLVSYLPDDILVKVDRASMSVGLEARVPLLDHRLVEFAWSLPLAIARHGGQSKWPLRQVLNRHVPQALVDRPKMGFGVPIDSWLRGPLRDWAEALLDARRLREDGFFDPQMVRDAWDEHRSGRRNRQSELWNVLMFQAWRDHTKEQAQALLRSAA